MRYVTVESTPNGIEPREIVRPGPTGLIVTTTRVTIHPENETRMLSLTVTDSREQTAGVMKAIAQGRNQDLDLSEWQALQEWIAARGHLGVVVPYAIRLAELIPPIATRLRRDFTTVLSLIKAHALLHQVTRKLDVEGQVIATIGDYAVVRELVAETIAEAVGAAAPDAIVEVVHAVTEMLEERGSKPRSPDPTSDADQDDNRRARRPSRSSTAGNPKA